MVGNGGGEVEFKMRTEGKFIITLWEINSHLPLFSQVSRERLWRGCCLGVCVCVWLLVSSAPSYKMQYNLKTIQTGIEQAFAVFRLRLFWVTKHVTVELFHQPTLMHNFLYSLTIYLLYYYPRHVSSINVPIFRRKNCIHTTSGIFALCKRLPSTL